MQTEASEQSLQSDHQLVPYGMYLKVWAILIVLTALTVGVSYLDMHHVTVLTATLIASVKGSLVLLYFMHVRFDERLVAYMIVAVFVTYAILIGLTFVDYWYR